MSGLDLFSQDTQNKFKVYGQKELNKNLQQWVATRWWQQRRHPLLVTGHFSIHH